MHVDLHWDHGWVADTRFEEIDDLILFDFGIHFFDLVASLTPDAAVRVFATRAAARGQSIRPPLLAQALIEYADAQASIVFDAATRHGSLYQVFVGGTLGHLSSHGEDLSTGTVTVSTAAGVASPKLQGGWFNDGFLGTMGELLCAIEEGREPENSAANCLPGLALAFAAVRSSHTGRAEIPGGVRRIGGVGP